MSPPGFSAAQSSAARALQVSAAKDWLRALQLTAPISKNPGRILGTVIEERTAISPKGPALVSDDESFTYGELSAQANRYTRWALEQGLAKGETVGLIMHNRPEYFAIWLGVTRAGCVVALANVNLLRKSLAHSINLVSPRHVIISADLLDRFLSALPDLSTAPKIWIHDGYGDFERIDEEIRRFSGEALSNSERRTVTIEDRALYVYTSGTTGLPKAANISHARLMQWSHWFAGMLDAGAGDRMYNCLPMYHSSGGVLATAAMLVSGGSVAIRKSFSVSEFWEEIVRWDCTLFQYIGELCRYLVHGDPSPIEERHRLRLCCGNGLRREIWDAFQSRFRIPRILEFYASTEGNVSFFNVEGKAGAIGRVPPYLAHRFPAKLVRFDLDSGEPVRDSRGLCFSCGPNETGEAIGRIFEDSANPGTRFDGYNSPEASKQKILHDVFERGDTWFRTGDLMRQDEQGYFYFVDRAGDTFRWKSENVSTSEVESVCCAFPGVLQATVYGVPIPGTEGKAGMVALTAEAGIDLAALRAHFDAHLPPYEQPLFLRVCRGMEITATFKVAKKDLAREGYNPDATADAIYFNRRELSAFVLLTSDLYDRIQAGGLKL